MSEVKDVFQRLLEDAPPMSHSAGEVLSSARSARNRRRNLLVAGTAALAVVAVAGSAGLVLRSGGPGGQPATPPGQGQATSAPESARPATMLALLPLRFTPGWVPPGWAEYGRTSRSGESGSQAEPVGSRIWAADPKIESGEVKGDRFELSYRKASLELYGGTAVDINGRPGLLLSDLGALRGKSTVEWQADGDTVVSLMQWGNRISEADLLRIARSVRPDGGVMASPLEVGLVLPGFTATGLEISGRSPSSWRASVYLTWRAEPVPALSGPAAKQPGVHSETITVTLGTETLVPQGGESITVGGRPARHVVVMTSGEQKEMPCVVVDYGNGLLLTVCSVDVGIESLVRVAEGVAVAIAPDLAWIGPR